MRTAFLIPIVVAGFSSHAFADESSPLPASSQATSSAASPAPATDFGAATDSRGSAPSSESRRGEHTYVVPKQVLYQGGDIPPFAHIETRPDLAYVAAGASIFGSAYATSLIYGLSTCGAQTQCRAGSAWLYLPLVGPFITSAKAPTTGGQALAGFDGGVQVLGATLALVGFIVPRKYVTWQNKSLSLEVTPGLGSSALRPLPMVGEAKPDLGSGLSITLTGL